MININFIISRPIVPQLCNLCKETYSFITKWKTTDGISRKEERPTQAENETRRFAWPLRYSFSIDLETRPELDLYETLNLRVNLTHATAHIFSSVSS